MSRCRALLARVLTRLLLAGVLGCDAALLSHQLVAHLLGILRLRWWGLTLGDGAVGPLRLTGLTVTALDGTDAGSSTRSVLVLQLAHGSLCSQTATRDTSELGGAARGGRRHVGGETRLLLNGRVLLHGLRPELLSVGILRTRQTVWQFLCPIWLSIGLGTELGGGVGWGTGLLRGRGRSLRSGWSSSSRWGRCWGRGVPREVCDLQLTELDLPTLQFVEC